MPKINSRTVIKTLLIILGFVYILGAVSRSFDYDFGWHLRFGRDFWENQTFSYTDSYTYAFFGEKWVNHEWGGDLLLYPTYHYLGYFAWVLFISLGVWLSFVLALKIFHLRLSIIGGTVIMISAASIQHIFSPRLTMLSLPLFALLWYFLERLPTQKNYWFWPILLWLWSALHGSWILGFIVIGTYITGASINLLCQKYYPRWYMPGGWQKREIKIAALAALAGAALICVNPYGTDIWHEVLSYFTASFYKTKILEWLPSYTYPVYWKALIGGTVGLTMAVIAFYRRQITWQNILLALGLSYAAFFYKRQAMWTALIFAPLFTAIILWGLKEIKSHPIGNKYFFTPFTERLVGGFSGMVLILLLAHQIINIHVTRNIWQDQHLLRRAGMPYAAVEFLRGYTQNQQINIFNEFSWGGYLNWALPNAQVFFDGRGAATWQTSDGENALAAYLDLGTKESGCKEITSSPANYIILSAKPGVGKPDYVNKFLFGKEKLDVMLSPPPTRLENDLRASPDWRIIYEDSMAIIWERVVNHVLE